MAASIQVWDQQGNLIFDSTVPRILRYSGVYPITWTYSHKQTVVGSTVIFYFNGTFPAFPGWNLSKFFIVNPGVTVNYDHLVGGVYGNTNDDPNSKIPQLPQDAKVMRY